MVLCSATVDLVSRRQRPYLFSVTVTGKPPHNVTKVYTIAAESDNSAAMKGLDLFQKDMSHPYAILSAL